MYKILLIDNEEIFTTTLKVIFNSLASCEIVAVVPNVDNIEADLKKYAPDIVLTRTFFEYKNTGFAAAQKIKAFSKFIKVIMMLDVTKLAHIVEAEKCGVDSCVLRSDNPSDFVEVFWKTIKGEHIVPDLSQQNTWGPYKVSLTAREMEVVSYLCKNMSYEEIGKILAVSKRTVTFHVGNIVSKTGHKNVMGLILEAAHKGYMLNWLTDVEKI